MTVVMAPGMTERTWRTWRLTEHELPGVEQEVGHEHPVHDHGSDERHQGEQEAGPLAEGAKVVPAHIRELPGRRVHRRCEREEEERNRVDATFILSFPRLTQHSVKGDGCYSRHSRSQ